MGWSILGVEGGVSSEECRGVGQAVFLDRVADDAEW